MSLANESKANKAVRRALIVFHLAYMGGILFHAALSGNVLVQGTFAALFFAIQFNLFKRRRKALTMACSVLIMLAAVYYLGLIGLATLTVLPGEATLPLTIAVMFLVLLEIATMVHVLREKSGIHS